MAGSNGHIAVSARRIACLQAGLTAVATAVALVLSGSGAALASLWGGVMAIVPMAVFGLRLQFGPKGGTAKAHLSAFYRGVLVKLALTLLICAVGIWMFGAGIAAMLLTFGLCQVAYPLALAADGGKMARVLRDTTN